MGKNNSGESSGDIKGLMKQISECVEPTKASSSGPVVVVGCSATGLTFVGGTELLMSVCRAVGRKLIEITKSMLRGLTNMCNFMLGVGELLGQFWDSWNKEMAAVVDAICRALGVKHWSELVIKCCRLTESGYIKAMASTLIAEKRSLVDCGNTAMPSDQRQGSSVNSAGVGTNGWPNSMVDGETQNY